MTGGAKKGGYSWAQHGLILTKADITNVLNVQTDSNRDNTEPSYGTLFKAINCLLCAGILHLFFHWKQPSIICN